jgi:uncharacterized glyoxalase superfamily protein PhnB
MGTPKTLLMAGKTLWPLNPSKSFPSQCPTNTLVTWFDAMKPGGRRGLNLTAIKQEPWGRYAMFSDPDGNGWILRQPPA